MRSIVNFLALGTLLAFTASTVLAQGSGTPIRKAADPYSVTKNITGSIEEINRAEGTFVVLDERNGKRWMFKAGEKTKYRADKSLAKPDLGWSDLQEGQRVRISFKGATAGEAMSFGGEVLVIKLKKPKTT